MRLTAGRFSHPRFALALVILLGLALRLIRLSFQPLWWDEGYSVWFATHPVPQMVALTAADIHPPLYYALLRAWTLVSGTGPVALRLLSVAVGVLAIPVIYLAGRRLFSSGVGLLAAFLLAISPLHVYYSQEVRMYGLVALLSAGVLAVVAPIFARKMPRWRDLVVYLLLVTAALYTQYYAVFLPVGLTIYAIWNWRRQPAGLARWLAAQMGAAILYLPWVLYATPRLIPYVSQKVVADADRPLALVPYLARHVAAFLAGHLEGPLAPLWPFALLLLLFWAVDVALWLRARRAGVNSSVACPGSWAMLAILIGAALLMGYAISRRYPFFPQRSERLLLLALPPFIVLSAAVLVDLWHRERIATLAAVGLAVIVAAASLLAFYTVPRYPGDDYRPLLARIVEQGRPEDTLFAVYPWQMGYWRSYGDAGGPSAVLAPAPTWGPAVADALDGALARGHVWFPAHLSLGAVLETRVERYLGQRGRPFLNQWYGPGTRLSGWSTEPAGSDRPLPLVPARFVLPGGVGQELKLTGAATLQDPVAAANVAVPLTLTWQTAQPPAALVASVRMVDALGQIWAQHDYELPGAPAVAGAVGESDVAGWQWQDRIALLVPAGTPPGRYQMEVEVLAKAGGSPLEVRQAEDAPPGHAVSLFELNVAPAGRALGPERLPVAHRQDLFIGDGLRFLGSSTGDVPWVPGESRKVNLFWQADAVPAADYVAFVQLLDDSGKGPVAGWEAPPGAAYPTSRWSPGTLMRTQATLRLPAELPDGRYRLIAGLYRASDRQRLSVRNGADYLLLDTVAVRGRPHVFTAPRPSVPSSTQFGSDAQLIGYDLSASVVQPGGNTSLTLYWQATGTSPQPYTVFVHLIDPRTGSLHGQGDAEPAGGRLPTTGWIRGEYLVDLHTVTADAAIPPGTYRVAVGLYDAVAGQRVLLPDGSDQYLLPTPVTVK